MSAQRDPWERIVSRTQPGLYESNYLKANSPDGERGLWIKHNLLRPATGEGIGEFWAIAFQRGEAPRVVKREVPYTDIALADNGIGIQAGTISITDAQAVGSIGDMRWDLQLKASMPPLLHLRWDWMYTAGFPKKKVITPAPNLLFNGALWVGDEQWPVADWIGLRGHNWGREHAWRYAYGNCNTWDDGAHRMVDGFSAKIRLPGGGKSPWLSTVMSRNPDHDLNGLQDWFGGATVEPNEWALSTHGCSLVMRTKPAHYVGLRYAHPGGDESYCYNTKFADVVWNTPSGQFTSRTGELEVLYDEPLDEVPLHPTPQWDPQSGDYVG